MLIVEASIRMNEFLHFELSDSPKMAKWAKYFILTLLQLIAAFLMLDEISHLIECAKMTEWLVKVFFDSKTPFYLTVIDYLEYLSMKYDLILLDQVELTKFMEHLVEKHFQPEQIREFLTEKELQIDTVQQKQGFIPKISAEERELEKSLGMLKFSKEYLSTMGKATHVSMDSIMS